MSYEQEPGWYKRPDGTDQYWDGQQWLPGQPTAQEIPAPQVAAQPDTSRGGVPVWVWPVGFGVLVVIALVVWLVAGRSGGATALQEAYTGCSTLDGIEYVTVADEGTTLTVDTQNKYGSIDAAACILQAIGTPSAIITAIDSTTGLMGVQTESANGYDYRWSYHPDNGMNIIVTEQ